MAKPTVQTIRAMRAAPTAEEAFEIGLTFLKSAAAGTVPSGLASQFAHDLKAIFDKHKAPDLYANLLGQADTKDSKASTDLRHFMGFKLTDHTTHMEYLASATPVLLANAAIMRGLKQAKPSGFEFAVHYASDKKEYPANPYFELLEETNARSLKKAISNMMLSDNIEGEKVPPFFEAVKVAMEKFDIDEQVDILAAIQDASSHKDELYELCENRILVLTEEKEPAPKTARTQGVDMGSWKLGLD